jgi:hypothetical protein
LKDAAGNESASFSATITLNMIQLDSNGQFGIDDIVNLIQHGTLQQQDMNGDRIIDREDLQILLEAVTPVSF